MRCPLCRGWVGLQAKTCACGFDLVTGTVGDAMKTARTDLWKAALHLLVGLGAGGALVVLFLLHVIDLERAGGIFGSSRLFVVLLLAAIFGVGRGTWLVFDSLRRLSVADRMRRPPAARVVQRDREPPSA